MEGFLHIIKKQGFDFLDERSVKNLIDRSKNVEHFHRIISNSNIQSIYYTNEYDDYPYYKSNNVLFCPVGQFVESKDLIQNKLSILEKEDSRNFVSNLKGAFLLSNTNLEDKLIDVYTHTVRSDSAFIFEDDSKIIIGTDPLIISVFSNNNYKPEFDPSNFVSFFEQGYFADESTPYYGISALPPNTHVQIKDSISYNEIDDTYKNAFSVSPSKDFYDTITQNFLDAFEIVNPDVGIIKSGLTGGKDSRLVLLALLAKDFNVETHTTGFSDHPDVLVAQRLAKSLGIPHTINERKLNKNNQLVVPIEKRLRNTMNASSGLLSAYDTVNTKTIFKNSNNFNGVAASVITGGFNRFNRKSEVEISSELKKHVYRFSDFYNDEENKYVKFLNEFSIQSNDIDSLLHLFFLKYRTGRWTSDSRKAKTYSSNSYSVFLDNQLTKTAMKLNMRDLRQERIHYEIVERLNPEVNKIPFFQYRYKFEENHPLSPDDYSNWLKREPIQAKSKVSSYNWRSLGNNDANLISEFKNILLGNKNHPIYNTVNYSKVETLLNGKLSARTNKFLWAMASMFYFMSIWENSPKIQVKNKITLDVSSDTLNEMDIKHRLINNNPDFQSLNNAIDYKNKIIKFNKNDKNPYLKTFDGGFSIVPKSKKITDVKSMNLNTHLTLPGYDGEIRKSIIFYTETKRFKTIKIDNQSIDGDTISIQDTVNVPKGSVYYRIVILLKGYSEKECRLNYSYTRLNY